MVLFLSDLAKEKYEGNLIIFSHVSCSLARRHNRSEKPFAYPKAVSDFRKSFFGFGSNFITIFENIRISQFNVSAITFYISFWISEKLFEFVMMPRLNMGDKLR